MNKRLKKGMALLTAVWMLLTLVVGCTHEPSTSLSDNDQEAATVTTVTASTVSTTPSTTKNKEKNTTKAKNTTKTKAKKTTTEKTKALTAAPTTAPTKFYTDIKTRAMRQNEYQRIALRPDGENMAIHLDIPADWTLQSNQNGGWDILRNKKRIGTVGFQVPPAAKQYDTTYTDHDGYTFAHAVRAANNADGFEWMLVIMHPLDAKFRTIYMTVSYSELSMAAVEKILANCQMITDRGNVTPDLLKNTNDSNKIAILGNSFVDTSQIGGFLRAFLKAGDKPYQVTTSAIGGGNLKDYAESTLWMARFRHGEYAAVFLCGFYGDFSALLGEVQKACDQSNTKLVIFPAHNEEEYAITQAQKKNRNTPYLLWKYEIDALIASGVPYSQFCIDDFHQHSKPLAGYVGAHMIYRSLFGEIPSRTDAAPMLMWDVRTQLGDAYMDTGVVKQETVTGIYVCS